MASTPLKETPAHGPSDALKLLRQENTEIDRQIGGLQARSRAYGNAIAGLEGAGLEADAAKPQPLSDPKPGSGPAIVTETYLAADRVSKVFAAAVGDRVPWSNVPQTENLLLDMKTRASHYASPTAFVVPNDAPDGAKSFVAEAKVPRSYEEKTTLAGTDLVDLRSALAGLAAPEYKGNRELIWPRGFRDKVSNPGSFNAPDLAESVKTVEGASSIGFDIAF